MSAPTRPSGFFSLKARAKAGRSARAPVEVSEWTRRSPAYPSLATSSGRSIHSWGSARIVVRSSVATLPGQIAAMRMRSWRRSSMAASERPTRPDFEAL